MTIDAFLFNISDTYKRIREKEQLASETSNVDTAAEELTTSGRHRRRLKYLF